MPSCWKSAILQRLGCLVLEQMEERVREIESCADPEVRESARKLVSELISFHGEAGGRLLQLVEAENGKEFLRRTAEDPKIAALYFLHGLHPEGLEIRVEKALESVRPYLNSHGGSVELLGIEEGRIRVRLQGSCQGCPSSAETLKNSIEEAILAAAPDSEGIEVV